MNWNEFQKWTAALCAWREARGEIAIPGVGRDAIRGVIHVIDNRSKKRKVSWAEVIFQWKQFSSMTAPGDPQLTKVPVSPDPMFETCYEIADCIFRGGDYDITKGADHYFATSIPMPEWAEKMVMTIQLGHHKFYVGD